MSELKSFIYDIGETFEKYSITEPLRAQEPEELHLELTYNCNTSCLMCNLRHLQDNSRKEMSLDDIKNFITNSKFLKNINYIVVSGGEALGRADIVDIIKFLRDFYPDTEILILSNLFNTAFVLEKLTEIKNTVGTHKLSIGSSLDGIGETHNKIRNTPDAFENLNRSLAAIRKEFPEIYFSLNFTMLPQNYNQMLEVYDFCQANNYHVSFQLLVQKKETEYFNFENHIEEVERQIDLIANKMLNAHNLDAKDIPRLLQNEGLVSQFLALYYIVKYLKTPKRFFPNCPCGSKFAMLNPFGEVYFCPVYKDVFAGDVTKENFDVLWSSESAASARKFFEARECHCWLTCTNGYMLGKAFRTGKDIYLKNLKGDA
ncbi:MAG: radical SAM protein [Elusimicrobia bacterium]|nr:radical SAM protein [Elusimicrobiota bacterium]